MIPDNIEINALISFGMVVLTASGVWWKLKGKVDYLKNCFDMLEKKHHEDHVVVKGEIAEVKEDVKELRLEVKEDKEVILQKIEGLKNDIHKNYISLLEAINKSSK